MSVQFRSVTFAASLVAMLAITGGELLASEEHSRGAAAAQQSASSSEDGGAAARQSDEYSKLEFEKEALCLTIESAARANDLPLGFFARVIWQESRFRSDAVGPVTHNGRRALGIAQFMPDTARDRGLLDPFDPVQALPKAAEFLSELRNQFGNLGLAAAAYNAGPKRVQEWLAGTGSMPDETRNYVDAITGTSVEQWAKATGKQSTSEPEPRTSCRELIALLETAPNPFVTQLQGRVTRGVAKPWGVQVATGFNREEALAMYARTIKRLSGVIGPQDDPVLVHVRGTSSFFQVRIGANTHREADGLCSRIRRAAGACLVKRRGA
ncbi:MAG TPA: lytic transglycosylase domain-containing protein [Bradyrhizobium sp.]|nr:lytic transglycosylase domain-containing protein [Bradyrhizobium sp.]